MTEFRRYVNTYRLNNLENLTKVAELVEKLLLKDKKYTWVEAYAYKGWCPELRFHQVASGINLWHENKTDNPTYGGFHVNDTYGVWGLMFGANEKPEDYIEFFENGIQMYFTTPAGEKAWWQIYIEED